MLALSIAFYLAIFSVPAYGGGGGSGPDSNPYGGFLFLVCAVVFVGTTVLTFFFSLAVATGTVKDDDHGLISRLPMFQVVGLGVLLILGCHATVYGAIAVWLYSNS